MQVTHDIFIKGIPYSQAKTRGNLEAPKLWTDTIIDRTRHLQMVEEACELRADFVLPADKYPDDLPYGPDLDNLLHRLFNALKQTVLADDSLITHLESGKRKADRREKTGVQLTISVVSES